MKIDFFQVDAFARQPFSGNPAAVCPLEHWLDDQTLQNIAAENNLSETAFFVNEEEGLRLRWFTPMAEIDLCGHATIATAHVLWNELGHPRERIEFNCLSGRIAVAPEGDRLCLDFPARAIEEELDPKHIPPSLGLSQPPVFVGRFQDRLFVELNSEQELSALEPNFNELAQSQWRTVIVSSASKQYDFVNRMFAPQIGINEDPVTGSAYTILVPYWAKKLAKNALNAKQISARGGEVYNQLKGDRVAIAGYAVTFAKGQIQI